MGKPLPIYAQTMIKQAIMKGPFDIASIFKPQYVLKSMRRPGLQLPNASRIVVRSPNLHHASDRGLDNVEMHNPNVTGVDHE